MLKKIVSFCFAMLVCVSIFAGCNVIEINKAKYYAQTVAEVVLSDKSVKTFTKKDLIEAYNSYGYQYVENGSTKEDAINKTVDAMIERALLLNKIKSELTITDLQKNNLKRETYKYINQSLAELEEEIRVDWEMDVEDGNASEDEAPLRDAYQQYTAKVEKKPVLNSSGNPTGEYKLEYVEEKEEILDPTPVGDFVQIKTDEKVSAEAWVRYIKQLQDVAKEQGKNISDEKVFQNEIDRIYNLLEDNFYLTEYQNKIKRDLPITTDNVVEYYQDLYKRDYDLYGNTSDLTAYHTAMKNDASAVYYHPNEGKEYMWVTHILFQFSDEQKAEIKNLKSKLDSNSIDKTAYEAQLKAIYNKTQVKCEENDKVVTKSVAEAYNDIIFGNGTDLGVENYKNNFTMRAKTFNNYIYKYNDDPGIMNKDYAYVVNLKDNTDNIMVKEFTDEARNLFEKGVGSISEPIITEHGFHVIMNLGAVTNLVNSGNINNLTWEKLFDRTTQPSSDKTIFQAIYDTLDKSSDRVTNILSNDIKTIKDGIKEIKYYKKAYKDLYNE